MIKRYIAAISIFTIALAIIIGAAKPTVAGDKTTVVVLDLEATGVEKHEAKILSGYVRDAIFKTGKYKLVDRKQLEAALKELKLSMTGLSEDQLIRLGKLLQAQKMISGQLGKMGNTYTISLQLMDIQTASIENIINDRCSQCSTDHLFSLVSKASLKLVGGGSSAEPSPPTPHTPPPPPPPQPPPQVVPSGMSAKQLYDLAGKENDINRRIQLYRQSIQLDPNYPPAYNDLAVDLLELNRINEAIQELNSALRIKPNYALAHYNLGRAYYKQQNYHGALREYETAARLNPKRASYFFNIGLVQKKLNNYMESAKAYLKCLELDPDYIDAYYNLGMVYQAAGNKQSAIYYYRKYIQKETRPSEQEWVEKAKKKILELGGSY